jgi:hypothetical protein
MYKAIGSDGSVYYYPKPPANVFKMFAIQPRLPRDNQGETAASIRMRMRRGWRAVARA